MLQYRTVESVMAGGDVDEKASVVSSSLLLHADTVRNVIIGLRSSTVASLSEIVTLRSHKHQLASDLDHSNTTLVDTRHQLNDARQQLTIEERRARDADELRTLNSSLQNRLTKLQNEIDDRTRFVSHVSDQLTPVVDVLRERHHSSSGSGGSSERERDNPLLLTAAGATPSRDRDLLNRSNISVASSIHTGRRRDSDASVAPRVSEDSWQSLREHVTDLLHANQVFSLH
jgi:myosin heavy subunit